MYIELHSSSAFSFLDGASLPEARGAQGPPSPAHAGFGGTGGETGLPAIESRPVLRRQRHPPAIRVSVEHGRPVYLAASRRGMPQGAVVQAAGPWRASGGWWEGGRVGWNRDDSLLLLRPHGDPAGHLWADRASQP